MKKLFIISCIVIIFLLGCNGKFKPPNDATRFNDNIVYYTLNGRIFSTPFEEALRFAYKIKASKIIIDIHSPGGAVHEVLKMIGLLDEYRDTMIIETKVSGAALSGGFILSISGDLGSRFIAKNAYLMWHHAIGPDEQFKKWADNKIFKYIAKKTNMTVVELEAKTTDYEKIKKIDIEIKELRTELEGELQKNREVNSKLSIKEQIKGDNETIERIYRRIAYLENSKKKQTKSWFITAQEAIIYGFADGYIQRKKKR